jgi:hypothetical protein
MTDNKTIETLDFNVIKEFWDMYQLADETRLKNRVILTGVKELINDSKKTFDNTFNKGNEYEFDFQSIQSFIFSNKSKGNPHTNVYTKQKLELSYKIETPFNRISEKWNEYIINDDGTRLKLKSTVTQIQKSNIVLQNGDPIYNVRIKILSKIIKPKLNN